MAGIDSLGTAITAFHSSHRPELNTTAHIPAGGVGCVQVYVACAPLAEAVGWALGDLCSYFTVGSEELWSVSLRRWTASSRRYSISRSRRLPSERGQSRGGLPQLHFTGGQRLQCGAWGGQAPGGFVERFSAGRARVRLGSS